MMAFILREACLRRWGLCSLPSCEFYVQTRAIIRTRLHPVMIRVLAPTRNICFKLIITHFAQKLGQVITRVVDYCVNRTLLCSAGHCSALYRLGGVAHRFVSAHSTRAARAAPRAPIHEDERNVQRCVHLRPSVDSSICACASRFLIVFSLLPRGVCLSGIQHRFSYLRSWSHEAHDLLSINWWRCTWPLSYRFMSLWYLIILTYLLHFCIVDVEEENIGRNRDKEFKEEQSREYVRPYELIYILTVAFKGFEISKKRYLCSCVWCFGCLEPTILSSKLNFNLSYFFIHINH